jgi:Acyl-CoA carboxylase epsilon subunit
VTGAVRIVAGSPTDEEAAAVVAAVEALLAAERASEPAGDGHPAYRSPWRRAAIEDALARWDAWPAAAGAGEP